MKNCTPYFVILFAFCSSLSLAQTKNSSPLMMMRFGDPHHEDPNLHGSHPTTTEEARREEEARDSNNPAAEEQRDSVFHVSELREALPASEETTQNNDVAINDLKSAQIEFITSKIDFLKINHSDQTDLIFLLESYLQKYEKVWDLRTFNQWKTDVLLQEEQKVAFEQSRSPNSYATKAQQSSLSLLRCEDHILNALLLEPAHLKRAQDYSQIHFIHSLSKDAYENANRQFELHSQQNLTINEYGIAKQEYETAKNSYHTAFQQETNARRTNTPFDPAHSKDLHTQALAKKNTLKTCLAKLTSNYGSLEQAYRLQQQCLRASDAMGKSGSFFKQKAAILEYLATAPRLRQAEAYCYYHQARGLGLLAQDHRSLAEAITEENAAMMDRSKKLISFALEAKSAFECHLSTLQYLKQSGLPQALANNYQKSLSFLNKAGQHFLSAHQSLKDLGLSPESQDLYDRGSHLMNVAKVFQLPLIPDDQRVYYYPDWLATIETAQHHAERAIQTATHEEESLYHEKIASFLHEKILALNDYFETNNLKLSYLAEPPKPQYSADNPIFSPPRQETPTCYFLEQAASQFLESSNRYQQLSQLSLSELNSQESQLLIQVAAETKTRATRLLLHTKNLLFPQSVNSSSH